MNKAFTSFEMKDLGGKKLHPTKWIDRVEVGGVVIPAENYAPTQGGGGTTGGIEILDKVIPAGKHMVKITVVLNDGTKVTGTKEVDFQMMLEELPPPPPE